VFAVTTWGRPVSAMRNRGRHSKQVQRRRGVVRRFLGDAGAVVIRIEREDTSVALMVESDVAQALVARYGVSGSDGAIDMSGIIGVEVEYVESSVGVVGEISAVTRPRTGRRTLMSRSCAMRA
jgi:hypothetical protein